MQSMVMKKYVYIFFFLTLITLKVSALHIYFHQNHDHIDECNICENVIYSQQIEFSPAFQFQSFEIVDTPVFPKHESYYKSICKNTSSDSRTYFGRPPPTLV